MNNEQEIWIKIQNYEGLYEVSNYGQVRRSEGFIVVNSNNQHKTSQRCMQKKILKLADN